MKTHQIGTLELHPSVIGFGAWAIGGGAFWGDQADDAEALRAIHCALDCGVNLIDTAPAYGFGRSERLVGAALRDRRDNVLIATKCGLWWQDSRGSFFVNVDGKTIRRSLRPDTIRIEVEHSLTRLQTDRIDLYQIHWPSIPPYQTPIADTMACLLHLQEQGKIRAIGVSNVNRRELNQYRHAGPVSSVQLRYSMLHREPEEEILPYCGEHAIATLAYMPLEQGLLTGKIPLNRIFKETESRGNLQWNPWFRLENRSRVLDLLDGWHDLTKKYECSLAQLVIAWTLAQSGITHVLCGARNEHQVLENAHAGDLRIQPADLKRMRANLLCLGAPATEEHHADAS